MTTKQKNEFAEFGRQGGKARAERLTPEQRSKIARRAAKKRWQKAKQDGKKGA